MLHKMPTVLHTLSVSTILFSVFAINFLMVSFHVLLFCQKLHQSARSSIPLMRHLIPLFSLLDLVIRNTIVLPWRQLCLCVKWTPLRVVIRMHHFLQDPLFLIAICVRILHFPLLLQAIGDDLDLDVSSYLCSPHKYIVCAPLNYMFLK